MNSIPFVKYTASGNNFVIIDCLDGTPPRERELPALAARATNVNFGIGCDNLLVVQPCNRSTLEAINEAHGYWDTIPNPERAELLFRMFEPDGEEAFCCGNGLMSIADYLYRRYATRDSSIMVELPLLWPSIRRIGVDRAGRSSWADMGEPRHTPETLVDRTTLRAHSASIDRLEALEVRLRAHDLAPFSDDTALRINGYLVFTGEPHLVVLVEDGFSSSELGGSFFSSTVPHLTDTSGVCQRVNFGTALLRRIGYFINTRCRDRFPAGVNVNLVRVDRQLDAIEYRCFERGINRETLACGTGALAVAYVARSLGLIEAERISVLPHRCRWYEPQTVITVSRSDNEGWVLSSEPRMLCSGSLNAAPQTSGLDQVPDLSAPRAEALAEEAAGADAEQLRLAS